MGRDVVANTGDHMPTLPFALQNWLYVLLLLGGTLAAYGAVWNAQFLTDDGVLLTNNDLIKQSDGWWQLWREHAHDYVPATSTSFWLEWRLWGNNPLGYHLDNVLLHALAAILVWRILDRLKVPGARLAAALFALHPVAVASVAWVSERKNTLAMVFYAAAILCYLLFEDTGKRRWYWAAAAAFTAAIFSKSAVAPLPAVLLGMAWFRRGCIDSKDVKRTVLFFILAVGAGALGVWIQHHVSHSFAVRPDNFFSRLVGAGWIVWFYLFKVLLPLNLIPIYPKWQIDASNPVSFLPDLLIVAVFVIGWRFRRTWGKAVLGGFGYFVLLLSPVAGFIDLSFMRATLVADHWQYFALIGPIALVSAGLVALWRHQSNWLVAVSALLLAGCLLLTGKHSQTYSSTGVFWRTTVDKNPDSFFGQAGLGAALFQEGKRDEALTHYRKALQLEPGFFDANYDLGNIALQEGRPAEAVDRYQLALRVQPDNILACNNLAWILATCPRGSLRNATLAVQLASQADHLSKGKDPSVMSTLAAAYAEAGQFPKAIATVQRALLLASGQQDGTLIASLGRQLRCYQAGSPYRDTSQTGN
jgi:cytochrome c-type biogenesis protein CcmH/NrfG